MLVTLSPELKRFVTAELKEGHYQSASEVVAHALSVLQEQRAVLDEFEAADEAGLAEIRTQIAIADEEDARGETIEYDSLDALRADIRGSRKHQ